MNPVEDSVLMWLMQYIKKIKQVNVVNFEEHVAMCQYVVAMECVQCLSRGS